MRCTSVTDVRKRAYGMRAWAFGEMQRLRRRLRNRREPMALVLMYHRVTELVTDPQLLTVLPKRFDEHLQVLRAIANPISLGELGQRLQSGTLTDRSVAITFDDGYADNLHHARPILKRYNVPVTVFVTTGQIGSNQEFWWDELDRFLLQPGTVPATLELQLNGETYHWDTGKASFFSEADYQQFAGWHIEESAAPTTRHGLYRDLYHHLHAVDHADRPHLIEKLRQWANVTDVARATHRTLSTDELETLAGDDLIDIGAHTVTHAPLAVLSPAERRQEITASKRALEELLGKAVSSFAYPHGSLDADVITEVRAAGFDCACSSDPDVVWPDVDRFRLPRLVVRDWDGASFARWLGGWFGER